MGRDALLTDGFRLLNAIPTEEIERRIDWLESALAAYKTMLVVKVAMETKPERMDVPDDWEAFVPTVTPDPPKVTVPDPEPIAKYQRLPRQESIRRVREFLATKGLHGAKTADIGRAIGVTYASASYTMDLSDGVEWYREGKSWILKNETPREPNWALVEAKETA